MILFRESRQEGRHSLVKHALSCVPGSDRHAENQLLQSTRLPTSGIVGLQALLKRQRPQFTHIHAGCRRGPHSPDVKSPHFHAAAVWQHKQTQVGSQNFHVSSVFLHCIACITQQPEEFCWYPCSSTVHRSDHMRTSTIMLVCGRRICC